MSKKKILGDSLERHQLLYHVYTMSRHVEPASIFYTIYADDINNSTSF